MPVVSENVSAAVRRHVMRDLAPGPLTVHGKVIAATGGGTIVSMLVCGQFGLGLTGWAVEFSHRLHHGMDPWLCALVCGALFAVLPALALRWICHPLQLAAIWRGHWLTVAGWFGVTGGVLAWFGDHGRSWSELALWLLAAVSVIRALTWLLRGVGAASARPASSMAGG